MQRIPARHRALRERQDAAEHDQELDERGLLGLDKLPIVSDVLTLVNGVLQPTKTTVTPTPTTSTPASNPTSPGDSGNNSGGGGSGDGGSSSGGSSGGDSGGSSGGSTGGDTGSGSESGSSGSGAGNGSGSDNGNSKGSKPGSSSSASDSTPSGASNPESSHSSSNGRKGSDGLLAVGVNPSGSDKTKDNAIPSGPTRFSVIGSKTIAIVGSVTFPDGLPTSTGDGASGNGLGNGNEQETSAKGGFSTGAAAGVGVVAALGLLGLILFAVRRRHIAKRQKRRSMWVGGAKLNRNNSEKSGSGSDAATAGDSAATRSIRSSFGTTFDHSEFSITFDDNEDVPQLPPMVEIRGGPATVPKGDPSSSGSGYPISPISPVSPASPAIPVGLLISVENSNLVSDANRRTSAGSNLSAQYAYDRSGASNPTAEVATPLSVRPFSPSESFAFPVPPRQSQSPEALASVSPIVVPQITESLAPSLPAQTPVRSENPFADAFALKTRASAEFDAVEMIWRPFTATLQDERSVSAGDLVKVLAVYDDGWAMIERVPADGAGKGKAKAEVGLIPIDCMRRADESVGQFLAAKRVSSVDATGYTSMAV